MTPQVALRPPSQVMRLERMGSLHQSRLSFMRVLLRRMKREQWQFARPRFAIDERGVGVALYTATTPDRTYTLVAFGHDLPPEQRSDRVIATAWDATFTLHDGMPTDADIERLAVNVPKQESGRLSGAELTLARANRSVRLFDSVVDSLAEGRQPDPDLVESVGYLMRTTAVYGSGKFGAADRAAIADRPELMAPFQAEMLTVFLIRAFVVDVVEAMAAHRSEQAVPLDPALRRRFGIGNSTGLGMAPFLLTHPRLINRWFSARETALARVRAVRPTSSDHDRFARFVERAAIQVHTWRSEHPMQLEKLTALRNDLDRLQRWVRDLAADTWDDLVAWSERHLTVEGQELVVSLLIELYPALVDDLADQLHVDESTLGTIDGTESVAEFSTRLAAAYDWAAGIDWGEPEHDARAWYVSAEKLEPRLGERHHEPIGQYEQPLQPARDAARMLDDLDRVDPDGTLADFLCAHPEHRHTARRLGLVDDAPYGEIRDNTIDATMLPIDLLRAKLSFFGATHFDPRSDRWVRINMFRGAPYPHELAEVDPDDWVYPAA